MTKRASSSGDLYDPHHTEAPFLIDGRWMTFERAVRYLEPALGEAGAKAHLGDVWQRTADR